ncbi:Hypothetical protein NTJ_13033 [Nesidiocoris tenuis]|uniref:Uncharacterized protein n=1 Tax=Nesidiocoris tenuis TaxID=355587 RepID=A0ABN7BAN3_9HEMI|nr:Hypothetical protein NTJ_13033 [Nesidiocoris tenuis]
MIPDVIKISVQMVSLKGLGRSSIEWEFKGFGVFSREAPGYQSSNVQEFMNFHDHCLIDAMATSSRVATLSKETWCLYLKDNVHNVQGLPYNGLLHTVALP